MSRGAGTLETRRVGLAPALRGLPWLSLALTALTGGLVLWPGAFDALVLDREALARGELWRLVTGHLVHWSTAHWVWDGAVFAALAAVLEARGRRTLGAALGISCVAVSLGVLWLQPGLPQYGGLSGVICALASWLALDWLRGRWRAGDRGALLLGGALVGAFAAKLGFEWTTGRALFAGELAPGVVPVPLAHVVGAGVGSLLAALPGRRKEVARPEPEAEVRDVALRRDADESRLDARARRIAGLLGRRAGRRPPAWSRPPRAALQAVGRLGRRIRDGLQRHWDVGLFDLLFGSIKAFGIYPALFAAGLGWTIPVAEYAPLNTQLWTAGYWMVRGRVRSALGRRRYGFSLARLERERDALLERPGRRADGATVRHRVVIGGVAREIHVVRGGFRRLVRGLRRAPDRAAVTPADLRRLVSDPELRLAAGRLRHNDTLYERVLIHLALADPRSRCGLAARSRPAAGPPTSRLEEALARPSEAHEALLTDQADALGRALGWSSPERLALRLLHRAYRRKIRGHRVDMEDVEYRLLARIARGREGGRGVGIPAAGEGDREVERLLAEHAGIRARVACWTGRCEAFVARVRGRRTDARLRRVLAREWDLAVAWGLRSRCVGWVVDQIGGTRRAAGGWNAALSGVGR